MADNDRLKKLQESISRGTLSSIALEFLEEHLNALSNSVDRRIYKMINSNQDISHSKLISAYAEKNAYNNIKTTLIQNYKSGVTSGNEFKNLTESKDGREHTKPQFSRYRS